MVDTSATIIPSTKKAINEDATVVNECSTPISSEALTSASLVSQPLTRKEMQTQSALMHTYYQSHDSDQATKILVMPLLAHWIRDIRGYDTLEHVYRAAHLETPPSSHNKDFHDDSNPRILLARTAIALENDLAVRDVFLLTTLTELPPDKLFNEALQPLGDNTQRDVKDTFGRGLRNADYRQPHYLDRSCEKLHTMYHLLPSSWAAQPLAMLSLLLWWQHKSEESLSACALALSQRPENGLARLVATAIEAGVYPQD